MRRKKLEERLEHETSFPFLYQVSINDLLDGPGAELREAVGDSSAVRIYGRQKME